MIPNVDLSLAVRLEAAITGRAIGHIQAYQSLHPNAQTRIYSTDNGVCLYCRPQSPLNRAAGFGLRQPLQPNELDWIDEFFHSRTELPRIDACPLAPPENFARLAEYGYTVEHFQNLFFLPLSAWTPPDNTAEAIQVTLAAADDAAPWIDCSCRGFAGPDDPDSLQDLFAPNFHNPRGQAYWGWLEGRPAGTGVMVITDGVVELGGASTLPEFRQRGVQTALLTARLAAAKALGCDLAIVLTAPGSTSQRNIVRSGFYLAYSRAIFKRTFLKH